MKNLKKLSYLPGFTIKVNTLWLFRYSMLKNMNISDVVIRYLAIENYYKKNTNGFDLYNEMMEKRVANREKLKGRNDGGLRFKNLIMSFEKNGFDNNYPIQLNKYFLLGEGSHRLALALYFNIKEVPICFVDQLDIIVDYSTTWFENNGLPGYKEIIEKAYIRILKEKSKIYNVIIKREISNLKTINKKFLIEKENNSQYYIYDIFPNKKVEYINDKKTIIDNNRIFLENFLKKNKGEILLIENGELDI